MQWSDEDTDRVNAAIKEALEIMGRYADEEALNPAFIMTDGKIPDPDSVIQHLNELAYNHLNNMIFLEEAEHKSKKGPNGIKVIQHYVKKRNKFDYTLNIPEEIYSTENYDLAKWLADEMRNKELKDRDNGKLSNSSKRHNVTWDHIEKATTSVDDELINNKDKYKGYNYEHTLPMVVGEINKILKKQGFPTISITTLNRRLEDFEKKARDVYNLFSDEARKIIKDR